MTTTKVACDGAIVFWNLSENFNRDTLLAGWSSLGFAEDVPEKRPATACMKDALTEVFGNRDTLVRPLADKDGFVVKKETRGLDDNDYATILTVKVPENSSPIYLGSTPDKIDLVSVAYHKNLGLLPSSVVGGALVKILGRLGATRLRPHGGVYWMKGDMIPRWESVTKIVEDASHNGKAAGFLIEHDLTANSVKAVQAAIIHEVSAEAHRLTEEITSGELGDRAIRSRKAEAVALRKKVSEYENLLQVNLQQLRDQLDKVEQANAVAAILLAGSPFEAATSETVSAAI